MGLQGLHTETVVMDHLWVSGAWGGRGIEIRFGIDHLIPSSAEAAGLPKHVFFFTCFTLCTMYSIAGMN